MLASTCFGFVSFLLVISGLAGEAPSSDLCSNAVPIVGTGAFAFDNTLATTDGPTEITCSEQVFNTGNHITNDVWFCWTAPCDGSVTIDTCGGTTVDTKIAVYNGCECPAGNANLVGCDNDDCNFQSSTTFTAAAGQAYLIQIGTPFINTGAQLHGGPGVFHIACSEPPDASCNVSTTNCRNRGFWSGLSSDDLHFRAADDFRPLSSGSVTQLCWWGGYYDGTADCAAGAQDSFTVRYYATEQGRPGSLLGEFRQSDGSLTVTGPTRTYRNLMGVVEEFAYNGSHQAVPLQASSCYWVEITNALTGECAWYWEEAGHPTATPDVRRRAAVDGRVSSLPNGFTVEDLVPVDISFCIGIAADYANDCQVVPANDLCQNLQTVFDGITYFDASGATTDGPTHPDCSFPLADQQIFRDVWFRHEATCTGNLRASACGSQFDTKLAVYAGNDCPTETTSATACDDNRCGDDRSLQSMLVMPVESGSPVVIRIGSHGHHPIPSEAAGLSGPGVLTIRCEPAPQADLCAAAVPQALPFVWTGSNALATPDCPSFAGGSVWVALTIDSPSSVVVDYEGFDFVPVFDSAWRGIMDTCDCATSISSDRVEQNDGSIRLTWNCLGSGTYYYPVVADPDSEGGYWVGGVSAPCTSACHNALGDCCSAGEGVGCGDFACCDSICRLDSYCCTTEWDVLCVDKALALCATCPGDSCEVATGDCSTVSDEPGCADMVTCGIVCTCNPFCCLNNWSEECTQCGLDDFDCDGITKRRDYRYFHRCYSGPCVAGNCSLPLDVAIGNVHFCCPLGDADLSSTIDLYDFSAFQIEYDQH